MTKSEFYKNLIKIQKETGQGLSGIVKVAGTDGALFSRYLDEFIKEGLVEVHDTGGSLGHPESNKFYMPTKGYNVWKDEEKNGRRGDVRFLSFVRFYLERHKMEDIPMPHEDSRDHMDRMMNPTMFDYLRDPEIMKEYSTWLSRNSKELKIMLSLDDVYVDKSGGLEFSNEEIEWIKSKDWFKDNETIKEVIIQAEEGRKKDAEYLAALQEMLLRKFIPFNAVPTPILIALCNRLPTEYAEKIVHTKKEIEEAELSISHRKKFLRWAASLNGKLKIKDAVASIEKKTTKKAPEKKPKDFNEEALKIIFKEKRTSRTPKAKAKSKTK